MKKMRFTYYLISFIGVCALTGCDVGKMMEPPLAITFRQGVLSSLVLQVNNLSAEQGMEVYVYAASSESSRRSGNIVIPANSAKEFGMLEMEWAFKAGDKGFVQPVRYAQKLFFEVSTNGRYRTWFGYDDIKEVDVAAKVRAEKAAKHEAMLKKKTGMLTAQGKAIFDAVVQTNILRKSENLGSLWPRSKGTLTERAKDRLREWKGKIERKLKNEKHDSELKEDISTRKFGFAAEYFDALFDVSRFGTEGHAPYISKDLISCAVDVREDDFRPENILPESVKWSVLADYEEGLSDCLPVLITSNFPCEKLRSFWDGKESSDELVNLSKVGDLADKAFVVVYKNGTVKSFSSEEATLANIYQRPFNTYTNGYNRGIRYLTLDGIVAANGMEE